jgi:hypothetical protein
VQRKQVTLIRQILYHKKKIFFLAWQRKLFSAEASKPNGRRKADKNVYPLDDGSSQLQTAHAAAMLMPMPRSILASGAYTTHLCCSELLDNWIPFGKRLDGHPLPFHPLRVPTHPTYLRTHPCNKTTLNLHEKVLLIGASILSYPIKTNRIVLEKTIEK